VPALAGLGAPWWRSEATASFVGMTLSTRREDLVRAVVFGIAAQLAELAAVVHADVGRSLDRLWVDGGLVRCRTLMQATADLLRVPVDVYPHPHATALGAAAAAQLALDRTLTLDQAVPAWSPALTYEPRWSADRAERYMSRWRATVGATVDAHLGSGSPA
jgi:glycerol kinase